MPLPFLSKTYSRICPLSGLGLLYILKSSSQCSPGSAGPRGSGGQQKKRVSGKLTRDSGAPVLNMLSKCCGSRAQDAKMLRHSNRIIQKATAAPIRGSASSTSSWESKAGQEAAAEAILLSTPVQSLLGSSAGAFGTEAAESQWARQAASLCPGCVHGLAGQI